MRRQTNGNIKSSFSDTLLYLPILVLSVAGTGFAYDFLFCLLLYTYTKQRKLSFANRKYAGYKNNIASVATKLASFTRVK